MQGPSLLGLQVVGAALRRMSSWHRADGQVVVFLASVLYLMLAVWIEQVAVK